jgi:hypothetical protein
LAKKNNFSKKTDNKKTDNKKTDNKKNIIIITCAIISISVLSLTFAMNSETSVTLPETSVILPETSVTLPETSGMMSDYIKNLSNTHLNPMFFGEPNFNFYLTDSDSDRFQNKLPPINGVRVTPDEFLAEQIIDILKPNDGSVVIYPVFTSASYKEPGFYTYFRGQCDESCITDLSFENPEFKYTSSGVTAQILYHVGYDFLTDIEVDQNPELLQNYDTVILLHNEYLTKKAFNAISNHPNLIFLFPNALYAEISVNYDDNTMTLIRGHQYPPPENPANGFDYAIEQEFHDYEYDTKCLTWEFIEIENGHHLNCYPDGVIYQNLEILLKMKEL